MTDEGASSAEQLLAATRTNNVSLITEILTSFSSPYETAEFLNRTKDPLGSYALHIAAQYGNYEVLDVILDQEGVEIDLVESREGDTCLHKAVRYVNGLEQSAWSEGARVVDILLDAGCDTRIRNNARLKPFDLVDPRNKELKDTLSRAEFSTAAGDDVIDENGGQLDFGGPDSDSD